MIKQGLEPGWLTPNFEYVVFTLYCLGMGREQHKMMESLLHWKSQDQGPGLSLCDSGQEGDVMTETEVRVMALIWGQVSSSEKCGGGPDDLQRLFQNRVSVFPS